MWGLLAWNLVGLMALRLVLGSVAIPGSSGRRVPRTALTIGSRARAVAVATLVFVVLFTVSGWLLPSLAAVGAGLWTWSVWDRSRRLGRDESGLIDALAIWIENVRDVLVAGEQPIGAVAATVNSCPPVLAPAVRRLSAGLHRQEPEYALRRFAADLDDPLGDLAVAGLMVAVRRGGRAAEVLTTLAEQARHHSDRRRLVEAERAPITREVWLLTLMMSSLFVLIFVVGRSSYLAVYQTTTGQVVLSVALVGYAALVVRVQRLARFPRERRFLTMVGETG